VNFSHFAHGTIFESLAPLGNIVGQFAALVQHHRIVLGLNRSGVPGCNTSDSVGCVHSLPPAQYLLIHMQNRGVVGKLSAESGVSERVWSHKFVGHFEPQWLEMYLHDDAHTTYSHLHWNCQHFAFNLLGFLGEKCRSEFGSQVCPTKDFDNELPVMVYQGKALWMLGASVLVMGVVMGWLAKAAFFCCRKRGCRCRCGRASGSPNIAGPLNAPLLDTLEAHQGDITQQP
jgi:hypothetical protein